MNRNLIFIIVAVLGSAVLAAYGYLIFHSETAHAIAVMVSVFAFVTIALLHVIYQIKALSKYSMDPLLVGPVFILGGLVGTVGTYLSLSPKTAASPEVYELLQYFMFPGAIIVGLAFLGYGLFTGTYKRSKST